MAEQIILSKGEKIAYKMIMSVPEAASKVVQATGNVDIKDMLSYMRRLVLDMEIADDKRRNNYVEVDSVELLR